jgi:small subunit ribosomal protein S3Ae
MANPKAALKKKKKEWYEILAPKDFGNKVIGETIADDTSRLAGRTLTVNLSRLTGDLKKQNINMDFVITGVQEGKCLTKVNGFWMQPSSIKRMVRPGVGRIDDSFALKTKDGINVRVKPVLIAKTKVKGGVSRALRRTMISEIKSYVEKTSFDQIIQSLVSFNLQKDLKAKLNKIYPLKASQIRVFEIEKVKEKAAVSETPAATTEEAVKEMPAEAAENKEKVAETEKPAKEIKKTEQPAAEAKEKKKEKPAEEAKPRKESAEEAKPKQRKKAKKKAEISEVRV